MIEQFHIVAFTHRLVDVNQIGVLHIEDGKQEDFEKLKEMSEQFGRIKTLIRYSEY